MKQRTVSCDQRKPNFGRESKLVLVKRALIFKQELLSDASSNELLGLFRAPCHCAPGLLSIYMPQFSSSEKV